MKGPEHEFDPTPMNAERCWKCGLEETNSVHHYPVAVSDKSIEEFDTVNAALKIQRTRHAFEMDWRNSGGPFDVCKHCGLSRHASIHGPDVNHPSVPDAPPVKELRCPACGAIAEEHLFTSFSGDKDWRCPVEDAVSVINKLEIPIHVSESWPNDMIGFFNPSRIKRIDETTFYIDDDSRLWAKTESGDELVSYDNHRHEDYERDNTWLDLGVTTQGPCSCLAHRTENCSDCFPVPNPSFGFDELGPSDLPPVGHYGFAPGQVVPSVPKGYIATPPAVNLSQPQQPLNGHEFSSSSNTTFSETDGRDFEMPASNRVFGFGDGVIAIVDDGPSNDEEYEVLGQMTVEQMMATVADITETIYPNQSALLLPKFELVLRAVFENADDAVNIG